MGSAEQDQLWWVIEPLVEAGVELGDIRRLLFRLGFEAAVADGPVSVGTVHGVVAEQSAPVRTAWVHVVGRLLDLPEQADRRSC